MKKNVLVLAPHTDDGELGCGGTIVKLLQEGSEVFYAAFSVCEESVPQGMSKDTLEQEVKAATAVLGIPSDHLILYRYPVRKFSENRQAILEDLIALKKTILFDLVLMPSFHDVHQDHLTLAQEGVRAFKGISILSYEMVWNNLTFDATAFVELEQYHIDKKVEALKQYRSQHGVRNYMSQEFIESLGRVRGVQIGKEYAETFEVVRWVV